LPAISGKGACDAFAQGDLANGLVRMDAADALEEAREIRTAGTGGLSI